MDFIQAAVLGIVQGLTEFLPISSSGHLLLFPYYLGWTIDPIKSIPFYVIVHFGTLVAVLTFFYKDVKLLIGAFIKSIYNRSVGNDPYARLAWFLIIGTIPAGVVYYFIHKILQDALETPMMVGTFLLMTGALLVTSEKLGKRNSATKDIKLSDVLFIGFAQGLAILPGISRSGSTIAAGLFRGLSREEAAKFSFLLSIPVIIAGTVEEMSDLAGKGIGSGEALILLVGFLTAAASGYLAIKYFIDYLKSHSLNVFALYCFALGLITIALTVIR